MFATETFVNYKQNQAEYNSAVFCKYIQLDRIRSDFV